MLDEMLVRDYLSPSSSKIWQALMLGSIIFSFGLWLIRLYTYQLQMMAYDYKIIGNNFHMSKGVILKTKRIFSAISCGRYLYGEKF